MGYCITHSYLCVRLMLTQLKFFYKPHIIYLGCSKSRFSETILLRTHNMCCGLVGRKVILHQALLSVCLVDVY